jgi:membrane protein YdbS with pleckstrin-like domain
MARRFPQLDGFTRARYLRGASHVTTGLWLVGWVTFGILVGVRAANDLISAIAVFICVLFAASFALQVASRRVAWREIRATMQRDDLVASRSRGRTRIRERRTTP